MLTEYADNLAASRKAAGAAPPGDNPPVPAPSEDLISSILYKELRKSQSARPSVAAAGAGVGNGQVPAPASPAPGRGSGVGIASEKNREWTVTEYAAKVDQLERTIKNLLQRNAKV